MEEISMNLKFFTVLSIALALGLMISKPAFSSGGIQAITGDTFTSHVEGNSYVVEGQNLKITIENDVVTVVKEGNTVKIDGKIEVNGTAVNIDNPTAANTTVTNTTVTNTGATVTSTGTTVTNTGFTGAVFKRLGF